MIAPAAIRGMLAVYLPWKKAKPTGRVRSASFCTMTRASRNSFQVHMKIRTTSVVTAGFAIGQRMYHSVCHLEQPSMVAASVNSLGVFSKNEAIHIVPKETLRPTWGRISAQSVSVIPTESIKL